MHWSATLSPMLRGLVQRAQGQCLRVVANDPRNMGILDAKFAQVFLGSTTCSDCRGWWLWGRQCTENMWEQGLFVADIVLSFPLSFGCTSRQIAFLWTSIVTICYNYIKGKCSSRSSLHMTPPRQGWSYNIFESLPGSYDTCGWSCAEEE